MKRRSKRSLLVGSLLMLFPIWSLANVTDDTKAKIKTEESVGEQKQMKSSSFLGSGTEDDPFLIQSPEDLNQLRIEVNAGESFKDQYFFITQDLDFEGFDDDGDTTNGNFTPIGTQETPFEGSLDGGEHIISNIEMKQADSHLALFNYKTGGYIKKLILDNFLVDANGWNNYTSSLIVYAESVLVEEVGVLDAMLKKVISHSQNVAGLIFEMKNSTIRNSYFHGALIGRSGAGLIYSVTNSIVENTYSATTLETNGGRKAFIINASNSVLNNNYYDSTLSGTIEMTYGIPLTTEDFYLLTTKGNLVGFDFNSVWGVRESAFEWESYPKFKWQGYEKVVVDSNYSGGNGLKDNPYQISKPEELNYLRQQVANGKTYEGVYFLITQDLDFEGFDDDGDITNGNFTPIGSERTPFKGSLDGGEHSISNIEMKQTDSHLALFNYKTGGYVKKLVLDKFSVDANGWGNYTSSLIVYAESVLVEEVGVLDAMLKKVISHAQNVAGLIYQAKNSTVRNSYFHGALIGRNGAGLIYSVTNSIVENTYSATTLETNGGRKALIINASNSVLNNNYYDSILSGPIETTYGIPLTTEEFKQKTLDQTLEGFDFENVWRSGKGYPRFIWEPKDNNIIINGTIEPTILNVSVPSQPISFALNPNQTPSFVAPTLTLTSETVVPIQVSLQTFEQVGNVMTDVLPNRYTDEEWQILSKNDSKSWALGIKNLATDQATYVAGMNGLTPLGVVSQGTPLSFEFVAKHGNSFAEDLTLTYQLVFLFELLP